MTAVSDADLPLLSFQEYGHGRPLLLLHGWGISYGIWRELLPLLSQEFRLIVPELPGIGASPLPAGGDYYDLSARSLEKLRVHLAIPRWDILGYSLGGWAGRNYARRWPQNVASLTYLCVARPTPPSAAGLAFLFEIDRVVPAFGTWLMTGWRLRFLVSLLGFNGKASPLAPFWVEEISKQSKPAIKRSLRDIPAWGLGNLFVPPVKLAFLWGNTDILGLAPWRPGHLDTMLRGTHALPMTNPEGIVRALRPLLNR